MSAHAQPDALPPAVAMLDLMRRTSSQTECASVQYHR